MKKIIRAIREWRDRLFRKKSREVIIKCFGCVGQPILYPGTRTDNAKEAMNPQFSHIMETHGMEAIFEKSPSKTSFSSKGNEV